MAGTDVTDFLLGLPDSNDDEFTYSDPCESATPKLSPSTTRRESDTMAEFPITLSQYNSLTQITRPNPLTDNSNMTMREFMVCSLINDDKPSILSHHLPVNIPSNMGLPDGENFYSIIQNQWIMFMVANYDAQLRGDSYPS